MSVSETVRKILKNEGRTQTWVVDEMNRIDRDINMDRAKLSAIVCGMRKMTGNELLIFCKAVGVNPDVFMEPVKDAAEEQ